MIVLMVMLEVIAFFTAVGIFHTLYEDGSTWAKDIQEIRPHPWEPEHPTVPMVAIEMQRMATWKEQLG